MGRRLLVTVELLALIGACSDDDRLVDGLVSQLKEPVHREQAIDGLLVAVREAPAKKRAQTRQRVVFALMEAYRLDSKRGQIVSALALLRDRRAEQVFVAALGDAQRGGEYFEAAIRSARLLGELGIRRSVPQLIKALETAHAKPREDRNTWLERTCIRALGRMGDLKASDVLIKVLRTKPGRQDFFLNKLAARSLGQLRARRAAPHLVQSLGATAHGLLLLSASRRALCRIGTGAEDALWKAATSPGPGSGASAMGLLGDLGDVSVVSRLVSIEAHKLGDAGLSLARAETLLRLGHRAVAEDLVALVKSSSASLTTRRRAAEILGWYGGSSLRELLEPTCAKESQASAVLCWAVALALSRQGTSADLELLDRVAKAGSETTRQYLRRYRPRVAMVSRCQAKGDPGQQQGGARRVGDCLQKQLSSKDWRARERAVLELCKNAAAYHTAGKAGLAAALARSYPGEEHAQVRQAILVGLEQLALGSALPRGLAETLAAPSPKRESKGVEAPTAAQRSRMICLGERLKRNRKGSSQ